MLISIILSFGLALLLIPCIFLLTKSYRPYTEFNEEFYGINGKINRGKYFVNAIIIFIISYLVGFIYGFFASFNINLIVPFVLYLILLVFLNCNNDYKRINAILDNHRIAKFCFGLLALLYALNSLPFYSKYSNLIDNLIDNFGYIYIVTYPTVLIIILVLLFVPSKKTDELKNDIIQECKDL